MSMLVIFSGSIDIKSPSPILAPLIARRVTSRQIGEPSRSNVTARSRERLAAMDAQIASIPAQIEAARARVAANEGKSAEEIRLATVERTRSSASRLLYDTPRIVVARNFNLPSVASQSGFIAKLVEHGVLVVERYSDQPFLPRNIAQCVRRNFAGRSIIQWHPSFHATTMMRIGARSSGDTQQRSLEQGESASMIRTVEADLPARESSVSEFIDRHRDQLIPYEALLNLCSA